MNAVVKPIPGNDYIVANMARDAAWAARKSTSRGRDARPDGDSCRVHEEPAAGGRPYHGLAAHDHPDRGAHRDAAGAGCEGPLGLVQHFLHQDHAAAAIAERGTPVFAWKGETLKDYWDYTHRIFEWPNGEYSNMILDDGGDATLLLHLAPRPKKT